MLFVNLKGRFLILCTSCDTSFTCGTGMRLKDYQIRLQDSHREGNPLPSQVRIFFPTEIIMDLPQE